MKRSTERRPGEDMPRYYRPPQGIYSECNLEMAQKLGYRTVFWSLAYVDWYQDNQPTDEQAFSKLLPRIHPGAIVLLHSTSQTNAANFGHAAEQMGGDGAIPSERLTSCSRSRHHFRTSA